MFSFNRHINRSNLSISSSCYLIPHKLSHVLRPNAQDLVKDKLQISIYLSQLGSIIYQLGVYTRNKPGSTAQEDYGSRSDCPLLYVATVSIKVKRVQGSYTWSLHQTCFSWACKVWTWIWATCFPLPFSLCGPHHLNDSRFLDIHSLPD